MIKTATLASIYEAQGLKEDALKIYREILEKTPSCKESRLAIERLQGLRERFSGADKEMLEFFINMNSEIEYAEFERWLLIRRA